MERPSLSGGTGRKRKRDMGSLVSAVKIIDIDVTGVVDSGARKKVRALRLPKAVEIKPVDRDGDVCFLEPKPTICPYDRLC